MFDILHFWFYIYHSPSSFTIHTFIRLIWYSGMDFKVSSILLSLLTNSTLIANQYILKRKTEHVLLSESPDNDDDTIKTLSA